GEDTIEIHYPHEEKEPLRLEGLDIGRPYALHVSPTHDHLLLANHRNELQVADRSDYRGIAGMDWSPDGRWAAYGFANSSYTHELRLWDRTTGEKHTITEPILHDYDPVFDPEGKYLYFLAQRDLNPVYDNLHFDLGFPRGMRPFLLTLQADQLSPFQQTPRP